MLTSLTERKIFFVCNTQVFVSIEDSKERKLKKPREILRKAMSRWETQWCSSQWFTGRRGRVLLRGTEASSAKARELDMFQGLISLCKQARPY